MDDPRPSASTLNPYSPISMTEAWQQHAVAPPPCMVSQDRSFQCTQCLKIFHQATDLLEHQCVQVEQKPFVCGVCKMGFSLLTSLAQHHNAHSSSNPMKCSICEKTYRPSSSGNATPTPSAANPQQPGSEDLRQHERTHSEERPFQCEECQMSFKQQYALVRHRRTHKSSAERPFKCNLCDKGFLQPSHLLYHQHVHGMESLFKCASCQKGFSQSSELLRHKCGGTGSAVAAAERPYKCDVCGKGYKKSSTLQRHQNSHCSEKPLKAVVATLQLWLRETWKEVDIRLLQGGLRVGQQSAEGRKIIKVPPHLIELLLSHLTLLLHCQALQPLLSRRPGLQLPSMSL
ncbi:hypothetical protein Z043_115650 [Scleropages formosus]|uniref:C2H2-type domain-containing protein n=1 Tax=Scleropages formosus TaxID=113540 RepID=A0A0N8JY93_SCLFO|nr:hypothetical protein Z043_115650 [Scleropages formosus]